MKFEIHFVIEWPEIYINGVGLFHHWNLHLKLAYYRWIERVLSEMDEFDEHKTKRKRLFK